jgi:hypothetical protein
VRLRRAREKGERRKEKGEGKGSESYSFLPFFLLPSPSPLLDVRREAPF